MHDESGTVCKVREEPAPCLITAQRLAERDGHVAANPCTFLSLPEAQCVLSWRPRGPDRPSAQQRAPGGLRVHAAAVAIAFESLSVCLTTTTHPFVRVAKYKSLLSAHKQGG